MLPVTLKKNNRVNTTYHHDIQHFLIMQDFSGGMEM